MKRMREISIACIALMLLLTAVTIPYALAHTECDPFITDLIAGGGNPKSAIDAGNVSVWNDCDTLYVKYIVPLPWYLNGTHLHVASLLAEIPQTKKHNPIPGHFAYKTEHGYIHEYTYEIPLNGWEEDDVLFIAAHAVVGISTPGGCVYETAWGDGQFSPGKNWATYFTYTVQAAVT